MSPRPHDDPVSESAPAATAGDVSPAEQPPHPGSRMMPRWDFAPLGPSPIFRWSQLPWLIGPGLVMAAGAIGGGEWLTGPFNTARYGGAILWLATLSIVGQTIYNIEICRYTLYTGEPIFTGKFRVPPGPLLWAPFYLVMDFGSFFPYLAANAAVPLAMMHLGHVVGPANADLVRHLSSAVFLCSMLPLLFGGKVYNSLKVIAAFKLVFVIGFLGYLALAYSSWETWREIGTGFVRFGTVPVKDASNPAAVTNIFSALFAGDGWPDIDFSMIGMLAAMAAIAGNGGLTNTPLSNLTRDQGWGMGKEVGAIPSIIGGHEIKLSHVGKVFTLTSDNLEKWRGWVRHITREQLMLWMPACFVGIALPAMLSIQFLPKPTVLAKGQEWVAAGMTAGGVREAVGSSGGQIFWYLTLFCGALILGTSMMSTVDGVLRRWVDVCWTASPQLRRVDQRNISRLYFGVLCVYATCGLALLQFAKPDLLLKISTNIYNYALGISCWHAVVVNSILLPPQLRPTKLRRTLLVLAGIYFVIIAIITTVMLVRELSAPK